MQQLGKYQILGVIGEGGMGTVYHARDSVIGRDVAIKVIQERALNVPEVRERFLREAQAAGRLAHENVMVIHDIGDQDGH
ncbi:MAG TPA: serine/threonine protein kinase, partial [Rhodothermales bacterium]